MSLVDAARDMATTYYDRLHDIDYAGTGAPQRCRLCLATQSPYSPLWSLQHEADCPVPMLPQIVGVLEAAERVAADWLDGATDELGCVPVFVGDMEALRAALRGDGGRE